VAAEALESSKAGKRRLPLRGKRVVITRARERAADLKERLESLGAEVILFPSIRIRPVRVRPIRLEGYTHVAFTSRTAVELFFRNLAGDRRSLKKAVVCAVGERTAEALRDRGVRPGLVSKEFTSRALARELCRGGVRGARVLHPGADKMNPDFKALLLRCGAEVRNVVLYRIEKAAPRDARKVEGADWITFASAQTARNFIESLRGRALRARVACIGPVTARAVREMGLRVDAVPRRYTLEAMVREIARKA
jgi:uroporphyrinogen III methyltransferase/synthase